MYGKKPENGADVGIHSWTDDGKKVALTCNLLIDVFCADTHSFPPALLEFA